MPEKFSTKTHRVPSACFSKTTDLISFLKPFQAFLEYSNQNHWFFPMHWNLVGPKRLQRAICLDMAQYSKSYFFKSTCFIFLSRCKSIGFYLWRTFRYSLSWSLVSTSELESRLAKGGKSAISLNVSWCSNSSSQKLQFWFLLSRSELCIRV